MKVKEKLKAMTSAVAEIEKQFGRGSVMYLGMSPSPENIPTFSTGSLRLDKATGVGGYPRGRIIEIYGPESSGKTTLTLHAISEIQRVGGSCAFIDAEHALDVTYARRLGVDVDSLLVSQPDHGEQALAITDILIHSGGVDLVIIDSVAALVPKAELEGEMGDHHVGLQARMMSKAMRKLTAITHRTGSTIIFINQIRQKIGVSFGSPETTTGGNALKFFASMRLDIRRISKIKDSSETIGNRTRVRVVKNKLAPPFKEAEFEIRFGEGISRLSELMDLGIESGVIEKAGSWLSLNGERLAQGKEKAIERLKTEPALLENLEKAIKQGGTERVSSEKKETKDDHKAA